MGKKYLTIILIILGVQAEIRAQGGKEIFTIYLVRHAEKDLSANNSSDPPLTECGEQRAESLKRLLSDVHLDRVYSTNYNRTKNTALPTAISKGLKVVEYNPQNLKYFSKLLIDSSQDALVVGHSNTTGVLAGLLVGEDIGDFDLAIYNRVYQVVLYKNNGRLHLLHTSFSCND